MLMSLNAALRFLRARAFHSVVIGFLLSAPAWGQSGSEDSSIFGSRGQGGATYVNNALPNPPLGNPSPYQPYSVAVGPNACVPTSTANGLTYLENYVVGLGFADPYSTSPNSFAQVDNLS